MTSRFPLLIVAAAALSLLTACGGGDASQDNAATLARPESVGVQVGGIGGSGSPAPQVGGIGGSGVLLMGTATSCPSRLVVTLVGASVNPNAAAQPGAPGWLGVATAAPVAIDLAALVAGSTLPIDFSKLPDGTYQQVRLLEAASNGNEDGDSQGTQGGPRLAAAITVVRGQATGSISLTGICGSAAGKAGTAG